MDLNRLKKCSVCHLLIAISFYFSGLVASVVMFVLLISVKPINAKLFRQLIYYPCYLFFSQLVCVAEWYGGSRMRIYMDPEDEKYAGKEHGVMMMNHKYEIDWLVGWMLVDKLRLLGSSKTLAKKAFMYFPIVGWVWLMADFVFLERNFEKDKDTLAKMLQIIYTQPTPTWVLFAAEGTRFSKDKHAASVKFAQERGLTPLKHHLLPRAKGFTMSLPYLRGLCPAVYDINLAFKQDAKIVPDFINVMSGQPVEPYLYIRRLPLDQVPQDEKAAAAWLQNVYVEKDRILDSFYETGSFFKTSGFKEVPCKIHEPRLNSLFCFVLSAICSVSSLLYYLISSLLLGNWFGFIFTSSIIMANYLLLRHMNNMSQISKASSYGVAQKSNLD